MGLLRCISLADMLEVKPPVSCVLALGNFDGVHLAHRTLLSRTRELRDTRFPRATAAVFCFTDLSSDHLAGDPPAHLSTLRQKAMIFSEMGMEYLFLAEFEELRDLSPAEFAELLRDECRCVAAVCGFNYRFGKFGAGKAEELQALLRAPVTIQEEVLCLGESVSSTRIRALLAAGDAETAALLLGRPYEITAPVLHGKALGRTWGLPTINQNFPPKAAIPRSGVYLSRCKVGDCEVFGVSNVGVHPTVDHGAALNCETYLLDFDGELYDMEISTAFLKHLREEIKFPSPEALRAQIERDIDAARALAASMI